MNNLNSSASHLVVAILFAALSATSPAWSDQERKPSMKEAATISAPNRKNDKGVEDQAKDLKSGNKDVSKKDAASVKKKAVKKAGTAAAVGVATKKVTSTIKKK